MQLRFVYISIWFYKDGNMENYRTKTKSSSNENEFINSSIILKKNTEPCEHRLSIDQKRENHVLGEQRRREILREHYDVLVETVPDLQEYERRSEWQIYMKSMCALFNDYQCSTNNFCSSKLPQMALCSE